MPRYPIKLEMFIIVASPYVGFFLGIGQPFPSTLLLCNHSYYNIDQLCVVHYYVRDNLKIILLI